MEAFVDGTTFHLPLFLPAITGKGARVRECLVGHRKICLLIVWLLFVLLICVTVIIGSSTSNDQMHINATNFAHQHLT
ncbi:unnamed protein product, partial [Mesorhabditis spiculigera]